MSTQSNLKCAKKKSVSIFDNLKSCSQPIASKVFGPNSLKDKRSSQPVLRSSNRSTNNDPAQIQSDDIPTKRVIQSTEPSATSSSKRMKNLVEESNTYNSTELSDGLIFAVILPLILDKDHSPYSQPLLVKIKESQLEDFGFSLPFDDYLDKQRNYFKIFLKSEDLVCQILACGDSISMVRLCLKQNLKRNSGWSFNSKVIKLLESTTVLEHKPLDSEDDSPDKRVLGPRTLEKIFDHVSKDLRVDGISVENKVPSNQKTKTVEFTPNQESQSDKRTIESRSSRSLDKVTPGADTASIDLVTTDSNMKELDELLKELERRKIFLSDLDTTGSTVILVIKALKSIYTFINENERKEDELANHVPDEDETFRISSQNMIFVEGSVQFDLDQYEMALKKSTIGDPGSFAYQIVRFCFPESYYHDVTLGKKTMTKRDIEKLIEEKKKKPQIKYPLSYIWGFKNPYNSRLVGTFDYTLGQKRVQAFINHVFRKSGILRYSEKFHFKVRSRIIKVLCSLNTDYNKSKIQDEDSNDVLELGSTIMDNGNSNFSLSDSDAEDDDF